MHTLTNHVGTGLTVLDVTPSRQEIERRIAAVSAGRLRRPVLVLGIDGADVPTRPDSALGALRGAQGQAGQAGAVAGAMARREGLSLLSAGWRAHCPCAQLASGTK